MPHQIHSAMAGSYAQSILGEGRKMAFSVAGPDPDSSGTATLSDSSTASPVFFGVVGARIMLTALQIRAGVKPGIISSASQTIFGASCVMKNSKPVRGYVKQALSKRLDELARLLLGKLSMFQERARAQDAVKARRRRRLDFGLREVGRGLRIGKMRCIIVATDVEENGCIDARLNDIFSEASAMHIPVVYALSRRQLGKSVRKAVKVSVVGIYNADGAHDHFKALIKLASGLRTMWLHLVKVECGQEGGVSQGGRQGGARVAVHTWAACSWCGLQPIPDVRHRCSLCLRELCPQCARKGKIAGKPCPAVLTLGRRDTEKTGTAHEACEFIRIPRAAPPPEAVIDLPRVRVVNMNIMKPQMSKLSASASAWIPSKPTIVADLATTIGNPSMLGAKLSIDRV